MERPRGLYGLEEIYSTRYCSLTHSFQLRRPRLELSAKRNKSAVRYNALASYVRLVALPP